MTGPGQPAATINGLPPFQRKAIDDALELGRWPWYFHGPAGRGKTYIAAAIYRHWAGDSAAFWMTHKVLYDFVMDRHTAHSILNSVRAADLLILDDIAVREPSGAQLDALLQILNARDGKPLIVTGNLAPRELNAVLDERCGSRICGGSVFEVLGDDRRLKQAKLFEI